MIVFLFKDNENVYLGLLLSVLRLCREFILDSEGDLGKTQLRTTHLTDNSFTQHYNRKVCLAYLYFSAFVFV